MVGKHGMKTRQQCWVTHGTVRIYSIRDDNVAPRRGTKSLHTIAYCSTRPVPTASNDHAKGEDTHRPDDGGDQHSRQTVFRLDVFCVAGGEAGGDVVDEPAAEDERDDGADEAGEREKTQ